jgi:hypothetical protein
MAIGVGIISGLLGGAALVGITLVVSRKAARSIDDTLPFGDYPALPEGLGASREALAGGEAGCNAAGAQQRYATHQGSHPHNGAASTR